MSWKQIKLGDAATFINGFAFKPKDWSNEGKEIIRIQNLTGRGKDINYFEGEIPKKYKVQKGDLLISWSATLGIFEWEKDEAWLNQHIFKVVFDKVDFDKSFFKHLVNNVLRKLEQRVHGSTMKHITKGNFDNTIIPLPPLPQQKRIAQILDKADTLRQKNKQLLATYDELLQATFLDMFGDPVSNPKGWEKKKVIENSDCIVPGRDKPKSFTGQVPWITIDDLEQFSFTKKSKKSFGLTKNEVSTVKAKIIPKGSVLMTCVGELGLTSIADCEMVINQQLHSFQCYQNLNNVFLMYVLSYQKGYMYSRATMTTIPYLNKTNCNSIPVILPPITLQNQFAHIVENIEAQKAKLKQSMQESDDLFGALVQKAFKGEL